MLADLIVHVVDASEPEDRRRESIAAVDSVLEEIGAGAAPRLLVFNKVDLLDADEARELAIREPEAIPISAVTGEGLDGCGSGSVRRSRRRCGRWSCCCPTPRERCWPSCTAWPATSSARTAPRGSWSRPGSRRRWRTGSRTLRETASARAPTPTGPPRAVYAPLVELRVTLLREAARLPSRAHDDDAGLDLHAAEAATIGAGERASVATGIAVEIPPGHAGLVLPRSGLAARHGIALVNSPGLIDPGYRGEVSVLLLNTDRERAFEIRRATASRSSS